MSCTVVGSLTRKNVSRALFTLLLVSLLVSGVSSAQAVFTQLVAFNGTDGSLPYYVYLAQGTDGQLYGTTEDGYVCCSRALAQFLG